MNLKSVVQWELKQIDKYSLLPHKFKNIGWVLVITALALGAIILFGDVYEEAKVYVSKILLTGLLLVVISKEKQEDEYINKLRMRSYTIAFIWAVVYTLFQPLINFAAFKLVKPESASYEEIPAWMIVWTLLCFQILFFHVYKKFR